jgi:hypothetical protein
MDCGGSGYEAAKSIRNRMGENEEKGADVGEEGREGSREVERRQGTFPQTVCGLIPSD